ncbi:MAG: hypothetical protein Q9223_002094 [Gallowayella weberi]
MVFFIVAGIFSSQVTKAAGNEVLIQSRRCGLLNLTLDPSSQRGSVAVGNLETNDTMTASTYSQACYGNGQNPLQCNRYIRPSLPWTTVSNATCPFTHSLCYYGATSAYLMDSGLLDSHRDLGINAPSSDRVQYRKITTCSPIHFSAYVVEVNNTNQKTNGYRRFNIMLGEVFDITNYTLQYNLHTLADGIGYALSSFTASPNGWVPIPALNRSDGDVTLVLLAANSIVYENPVTDPFFAATTEYSSVLNDGLERTFYTPDSLVSGIACVDQHQFCNPANRKCTPLTGFIGLDTNSDPYWQIGLSRTQYITAKLIAFTSGRLTTYYSIASRGVNALRASETVVPNTFFQIGLPNTQWMVEVSSWFAISMAKLQLKTVQYATGPPYIPEGYNLVGPESKEEENICKNQIIRNAKGTTSFSVLGVTIILVVGAVLILGSFALDPTVQLVRHTMRKNEYKIIQYAVDGTWQLQRLAYEEAGQGHWSGGVNSVPLTRVEDKIGLPRDANQTHPRLSQASKPNEHVLDLEELVVDPESRSELKQVLP